MMPETETPAPLANWRLQRTGPAACHEWTSFGSLPPALGPGAGVPGSVCRAADGAVQCLHVAPERWLLPDPTADLLQALQQAERDGTGVVIDVTGRWCGFRVAALAGDASASHPLAAALPVELLLAERDCAFAWAFDCPIILVREGRDLSVWVETSYQASFVSMLATLGVAT